MVQVIGKANIAKQVTCRNCANILEYLPIDIKEYKSYDYTGGCDIVKHIVCPCGKDVTVARY